MSFGTANLEDDSTERERAAKARFASDLLVGEALTDPATWTPNTVFIPAIMYGTSTAGNATFDIGAKALVLVYSKVFAGIRPQVDFNFGIAGTQVESWVNLLPGPLGYPALANAPDPSLLHAPFGGSPGVLRVLQDVGLSSIAIRAALRQSITENFVLALPEDPVIEWRDDRARAAIEAIDSSLADLGRFDDVRSRLKELVALATEEYPETDIPHSVALGAFAAFIRDLDLRNMHLSLTPGGHLVAEWRAQDGRRAAFQFLPDRTVNFSARIPDSAKGGRPMPIYGAASLDGLLSRVLDDTAFSWID